MVELRPFTGADIPTLIGWIDSPEFLMQWAGPGLSYPLDEGQLEQLLAETARPEPAAMAFKAVGDGGETVGHIELLAIDRKHRSATLARVLVGPESLRGRGIGRQMVQQVLRIGFEKLGLHRIQLHVFDFNQGAVACYEACGFRKEGHLRDARRVGDRYWSLYLMSILEEEWRALLAARL